MFLSSKKIGLLATAFRQVQTTETVKHGEQLLKELRKQEDYQLGLTTFLSVSKDYNQKILAVLELKKILQLKCQQSFWSLKTIYYKDIQKISINIRKIISYYKNIEWAGMFLKIDSQKIGLLESVRYFELVFCLLKKQERVQLVLKYHFDTLLQGLIIMIEAVNQSEQCLLMNLVCIATLFSVSLELDFQFYQQKIKKQWQKARQKCKFCMNDSICVVSSVIQTMLGYEISNLEVSNLQFVIVDTFKNLVRSQNSMIKYHSKLLSLMAKYLQIFAVKPTIITFVSAFNDYNNCKIDRIIASSQLNIEIDLNNFIEEQIQSYEQSLIRQSLCYFIQQIFDKHYSSIVKQYCTTDNTTHPLYYFLLPLVNFYNSSDHQNIKQFIAQNLQNIIDSLGKNISFLTNQSLNKLIIKDCIIFIEFLIKYKSQIPIQLLIHVSNIMQDLSAANTTLSPFCYNFIEHIWEDFAYLDYVQLTDFLLQHITKLNQNQWDHKLQYYSSFLNLSNSLQKHYQFYSNFANNDLLVMQSLKSHSIIVSLLQQTPQNQINHELIILLLQLTCFFIKGIQTCDYGKFHKVLNINVLNSLTLALKIFSEESANLIVFDLLVKNQLPVSYRLLDYLYSKGLKEIQFKCQILIKQIDCLKILNQYDPRINFRRYDELFWFLDSLDQQETTQLKQSKLWPTLEEISTICNHPLILK